MDIVGLHAALGHELPASGEEHLVAEFYWHLKVREEYLGIATRTKAESIDICWDDETGVSNCELVERGFSSKGRLPILRVETKRQRVNMISIVNN